MVGSLSYSQFPWIAWWILLIFTTSSQASLSLPSSSLAEWSSTHHYYSATTRPHAVRNWDAKNDSNTSIVFATTVGHDGGHVPLDPCPPSCGKWYLADSDGIHHSDDTMCRFYWSISTERPFLDSGGTTRALWLSRKSSQVSCCHRTAKVVAHCARAGCGVDTFFHFFKMSVSHPHPIFSDILAWIIYCHMCYCEF